MWLLALVFYCVVSLSFRLLSRVVACRVVSLRFRVVSFRFFPCGYCFIVVLLVSFMLQVQMRTELDDLYVENHDYDDIHTNDGNDHVQGNFATLCIYVLRIYWNHCQSVKFINRHNHTCRKTIHELRET